MTGYVSPAWRDAIGGFLEWQASAGLPATTRKTRGEHLQHLARRVKCGPWELTLEQLTRYMSRNEWAAETRRGRRSTFVAFWEYALERGFAEVNLGRALPRVKPGQPAPRPIPESAYREALAKSDERIGLALRLAHDLGLRRAEIAQIHSDDLVEDFIGWSLRVHGKGAKTRIVPLTGRLALALRSLPSGWAFPGDDMGHLSPRWLGKLASQVLPHPYTMHTLRHSFASRAYAHDRDLLAVQELLGHASPATTRTYVVLPDDSLRRTIDAIA